MFIEGLFSLLANDSGVSGILGTNRSDGTTGIFPNVAPDSVNIPYMVYTEVHREPILSYEGVNPLQTLRFQLACYGSPYLTVKQLAEAIKNVLDGFVGELSDGSVVGSSMPLSEHDESEPIFHGTMYGVILDYSFVTTDAP